MIRNAKGQFLQGVKLPPKGTPAYKAYQKAYNAAYYARTQEAQRAAARQRYRDRLGGTTKRALKAFAQAPRIEIP